MLLVVDIVASSRYCCYQPREATDTGLLEQPPPPPPPPDHRITNIITSNYGGIETNLRTEFEFATYPLPGKRYPGQQGFSKGICYFLFCFLFLSVASAAAFTGATAIATIISYRYYYDTTIFRQNRHSGHSSCSSQYCDSSTANPALTIAILLS